MRRIMAALQEEGPRPADDGRVQTLRQAAENLRKQHLWGDISDDEYRRERSSLERQIKLMMSSTLPFAMPNLERAAGFLKDLPKLWSHPGVTHDQRELLVKEVFARITIDGKSLTSVEPKAPYVPLVANIVVDQGFGYRAFESRGRLPTIPPVSGEVA